MISLVKKSRNADSAYVEQANKIKRLAYDQILYAIFKLKSNVDAFGNAISAKVPNAKLEDFIIREMEIGDGLGNVKMDLYRTIDGVKQIVSDEDLKCMTQEEQCELKPGFSGDTEWTMIGLYHGMTAGELAPDAASPARWGIYWEWVECANTWLTNAESEQVAECIRERISPKASNIPNALGYFVDLWSMVNSYQGELNCALSEANGKECRCCILDNIILKERWDSITVEEVNDYIGKLTEKPQWHLMRDVCFMEAATRISRRDNLPKQLVCTTDEIAKFMANRKINTDTPETYETADITVSKWSRKKGVTKENKQMYMTFMGDGNMEDLQQFNEITDGMMRIANELTSIKMQHDTEKREGECYLSIYELFKVMNAAEAKKPSSKQLNDLAQMLVKGSCYLLGIPWLRQYVNKKINWNNKEYIFLTPDPKHDIWVPFYNIRFVTHNEDKHVEGIVILSPCEWQAPAICDGKYIIINSLEQMTFNRTIGRGIHGMTVYLWLREKREITMHYGNQGMIIDKNGDEWHKKTFPLTELANILGIDISAKSKHRSINLDRLKTAIKEVIGTYKKDILEGEAKEKYEMITAADGNLKIEITIQDKKAKDYSKQLIDQGRQIRVIKKDIRLLKIEKKHRK